MRRTGNVELECDHPKEFLLDTVDHLINIRHVRILKDKTVPDGAYQSTVERFKWCKQNSQEYD